MSQALKVLIQKNMLDKWICYILSYKVKGIKKKKKKKPCVCRHSQGN